MADAPKEYTYTSKYLARGGWGLLALYLIAVLVTAYLPVTIAPSLMQPVIVVGVFCLFASELVKRLETIDAKLDELLSKKD